MDHTEFYKKLHLKDQERLKHTVEALKKAGFDVYATGSALEGRTYNDIDLVVEYGNKEKRPTIFAEVMYLDKVIEELAVQGAEIKEMVAAKISHPYDFSDVHLRYIVLWKNELPENVDPAYEEFKNQLAPDTEIDVAYTDEAFSLDPGAKRVRL